MAKSENQKLKLLYLRDYLRQNSDEEHPVPMQQLVDHLASKGIRAERKSIYDDIQALNAYGEEIICLRNKGYYVTRRDFELPELKLLVDAVLSSRFLTSQRSAGLIRKLAALSSTHESDLLRREIVLSGRVKTDNEGSFVNIDILHEAIASDRQVIFRYFDWGVDGKKHFRPKNYTASPYALVWDDENYYLVAHTEKHGITHYRVDKMEDIFLTEARRVVTKETQSIDPAAYSKAVFGMYNGSRKRVKLRFENALAGVVIDRFGKDSMLLPDGSDHFTLTVEVSISPNFLGWVARFGGRAAIVFPKSAVEAYRKHCQAVLDAIPAE